MALGAISAGHETTLESAEEILRAGGNAFDAVISATFSMFAAEPCMASAGAGGFAMCHSANQGVRLLDFFVHTPKNKDLERALDFDPIEVDFGSEKEIFHVGKASIAVPGIISGLFMMHREYGRMPMKDLVQHAQAVSKAGVRVNAFGEIDMNLLQEIFCIDPEVADIFFRNGEVKKEGDTMEYPHLAGFLDFIAAEGDKGFYRGEIGQKLSEQINDGGGFLTRADFENYSAQWKEVMQMSYHGMQLCLPNGPSMGGAIMALLHHHRIKDGLSLNESLIMVKEELHGKGWIPTAMKAHLPELEYKGASGMASKGTSHINVMDSMGNAVALTSSIGEGSGYWIPNSDMQMNNMLGETFLLPNGHHSWLPDVRLSSMMTPVMVLDKERKVHYCGGSGGAGRIPYMIYQVMEAFFDKGLHLEEATIAPRLHLHDDVVHYEKGCDIDKIGASRETREWQENSLFFGGVHSVTATSDGEMEAAGDPRRYGVGKVL